jgi:K+/H+ antiporter YhaU regulatory subunit KhtT
MLRHSRPWDSGVVILAVRRNDVLLPGIPGPSDVIEVGDVLVIYGQEDRTKFVMQEAPKS